MANSNVLASDGRQHAVSRQERGDMPAAPASENQVTIRHIDANVRVRKSDNFHSSLKALAVCATVVGVFYFMSDIAASLAGRNTVALFSTLVDVHADRYFFLSVAALTSYGYARERRTRKRAIADLSEYIQQLESRFDPNRSGSHLSKTGDPEEG